VKIRDYQLAQAEGARDPALFAAFCDDDSAVLGVSTSGMALPLVVLALRQLKAERPELVTVLGGIGASGAAVQIIEEFPWIDFVVCGEGEESLRDLLDRLEAGEDTVTIEGLVCRSDGRPRVNPARQRISKLDRIEAHAWDYLDLTKYSMINIATARGCPFPCTFCDVAPYWHHRYTVRSVEAVVNEVKAIIEKVPRPPTFVFVDDTLTIDKRRIGTLCAGLRALPFDVQWACYARADALDDKLLDSMAASGCCKIYLGLESGANHILEKIRKGFDSETGRKVALLSRQYIPIVQTSFVWGFPFETLNEFYETLLMMGYLVSHGVSVKANVLTPLPFSELFAEYEETITFMPEYSPQLLLAGYELGTELCDLIQKYPRIFPCFYLYKSETLNKKYNILREMGLSPEDIWDIWEQMKGPVPVRKKRQA
jgi:radical SAM superfamily enzyme YgiQ (UPF0313 family)